MTDRTTKSAELRCRYSHKFTDFIICIVVSVGKVSLTHKLMLDAKTIITQYIWSDNGNLNFTIVIRTPGYYEPSVLRAYYLDGHRVNKNSFYLYTRHSSGFRIRKKTSWNIWILGGPENAAVETKKTSIRTYWYLF